MKHKLLIFSVIFLCSSIALYQYYRQSDDASYIETILEDHFNYSQEKADLSQLLGFSWDRFCVFVPIDSAESDLIYSGYLDYIEKHNIQTSLKERNYSMIFLFQQGSDVKAIGFNKGYLYLNKKRNFLDFDDHSKIRNAGFVCYKGDVSLERKVRKYNNYEETYLFINGNKLNNP